MNKRTFGRQSMAIAAVAVFAVALGAGSTAAMASAGGNPVTMSAVLASKQSPEDVLPAEDGRPYGDGLGLVSSSSRSLGSTETSNYWIVLDAKSNVCLVGQFLNDRSSSMTCITPENFQKVGIASLRYSDTSYAEAYLAPDGLQASEVPAGLKQLESGLITGDSRPSEGVLKFRGGDGGQGRIAESSDMRLLRPVDLEDVE